jgi:hypothetical protein
MSQVAIALEPDLNRCPEADLLKPGAIVTLISACLLARVVLNKARSIGGLLWASGCD